MFCQPTDRQDFPLGVVLLGPYSLSDKWSCKDSYEGWELTVILSSQSLKWHHNESDCVSNHQPHDCLLNRLFRRRSKKTSKLRGTGLCAGNSPGKGEFPAQRASYAENVSIWWRHHDSLWPTLFSFHMIKERNDAETIWPSLCRRHVQKAVLRMKIIWSDNALVHRRINESLGRTVLSKQQKNQSRLIITVDYYKIWYRSKRFASQIPISKILVLPQHQFCWPNRFEFMRRIRQRHCRALCNTSETIEQLRNTIWTAMHYKSPASRMFAQPFVQAEITENIKAPRHWPVWGESTSGFPHKGPVARKMFPFDDVIMGVIHILQKPQWCGKCSNGIPSSRSWRQFCRSNEIPGLWFAKSFARQVSLVSISKFTSLQERGCHYKDKSRQTVSSLKCKVLCCQDNIFISTRGPLCQKQVSTAGINNHIPQIL